ncbi:unnamed protein product [Ranitomeya imitator]|uniref:Uncharacterized protein n=1 Tax=Ranitomeya imitator TaxID=111125 RepID=A0ABN9M7Z0_9NEOB|nr:unnamed protein product [Ranitomeya imitator]
MLKEKETFRPLANVNDTSTDWSKKTPPAKLQNSGPPWKFVMFLWAMLNILLRPSVDLRYVRDSSPVYSMSGGSAYELFNALLMSVASLLANVCFPGLLRCSPSLARSVMEAVPKSACHHPVPRVSVSSSCTPSVSVIILYPECQCHYPVPRVSVSLSCTPSVSVIILYPECQCHYPVPRVSVSLSCTPSVSVIILYPECQCHYPVPISVSVIGSCTPSVSVIILYPECQCHYPVPRVSVSLSCTPSRVLPQDLGVRNSMNLITKLEDLGGLKRS